MEVDLGTLPQWLTVVVAIVAVKFARRSILSQRDTARKRAAIDFFLKGTSKNGSSWNRVGDFRGRRADKPAHFVGIWHYGGS
jgi:hypothetical protein